MAFLPTHSAYQTHRAHKEDVLSYYWGRIHFVVVLMIYDTEKNRLSLLLGQPIFYYDYKNLTTRLLTLCLLRVQRQYFQRISLFQPR